MNILGIIPARFASTRLPGKPLLDICGKPMIQHVYENASNSSELDELVVATDDERIANAVRSFGGNVMMTSADCKSGSDRVLEVANRYNADIYINIQGDEPFLPADAIDRLAKTIRNDTTICVATLCHELSMPQAGQAQHVKVVCKNNGDALYFSRSLIPFNSSSEISEYNYLVHRGIYAFKSEALKKFGATAQSHLEKVEKLEQLRLLQSGIPIRIVQVEPFGPSIDVENDLYLARKIFSELNTSNFLSQSCLTDIEIILFDVDGVLTDGNLFYTPDGETIKSFNVRDGVGVSLLKAMGIKLGVISGRRCAALEKRLDELDIQLRVLGCTDKIKACYDIFRQSGTNPQKALFVGDDLPDLPAFSICALSACPINATPDVINAANFVLSVKGGCGVVREIAELIMKYKESRNI